ncbi:unnamed protein product [Anisakis simplex]|uniref:Uncharacterized protein n=1 Tax=Anisakis simplex TaxID=6269 RepID=A0A0M3JU11_ANISI|nr:unnamed protein product [Anisakis simplex]
MALGNSYVNEGLNIDMSVRYAYGHGIIDEKTWTTLENEFCHGCNETCALTQVIVTSRDFSKYSRRISCTIGELCPFC